jgi:Domain of unknown function (DUF6894)
MQKFFFAAEYDGATCNDDEGETFPTAAEAIAYGLAVATELSRNNPKPVSISVLDRIGCRVATLELSEFQHQQ